MASNGFILSVLDLDLTPLVERHVLLPIRIGRSSLNDVPVAHRLVSEFHARVEHVDGRLCVRDLGSKNGVLLESLGDAAVLRVTGRAPVDLEPYGYEFLLSPMLRVRVRPASAEEAARPRDGRAIGSVLGSSVFAPGAARGRAANTSAPRPGYNGNGASAGHGAWSVPPPTPRSTALEAGTPGSPTRQPASVSPPPTLPPLPWSSPAPMGEARPLAVPIGRRGSAGYANAGGPLTPVSASPAVQPYASVFIEPPSGPLELPPVAGAAYAMPLPEVAAEPAMVTRMSRPSPRATLLEPGADAPAAAHAAWDRGHGTLPAASFDAPAAPSSNFTLSLEALALRGLRELAASLLPGQSVDDASDVIQLVTKLHDTLEMFCRCFIPVREACSRFSTAEELERTAAARCQHRSGAYLAVERALEPAAVAAALLDWREPAQDAPLAVEHILADLMLQQLTTLHAALDGTRALIDELSPARFEAEAPRSPSVLSRLGLAGARERLLWEAFAERHQELASAGATFRELFGDAFSRLYEASQSSGNPPV